MYRQRMAHSLYSKTTSGYVRTAAQRLRGLRRVTNFADFDTAADRVIDPSEIERRLLLKFWRYSEGNSGPVNLF